MGCNRTANRYISGSSNNGSKMGIPTLLLSAMKSSNRRPREVVTKEEKSKVLVRLMFPRNPPGEGVLLHYNYPARFPGWGESSEGQLCCHIMNLSPYKAAGLDEIPNMVLNKCTDLLVPYLVHIFRLVLGLRTYIDGWQDG